MLLDLYGTNHDRRICDEPNGFRPERFQHWDGNSFTLIPQGGGDHATNQRCAGEWATVELVKHTVRLLTASMRYAVPAQELHISLSCMPAMAKSGFIIRNM